MSEKGLSLGINVSIIVILTIFGVLLSLPLRLLFNTNYNDRNQTESANDTMVIVENAPIPEVNFVPVDYRKLKRCPKFQYKDRLMSVFRCDYDGNCTYAAIPTTSISKTDDDAKNETRTKEDSKVPKASKVIVGENLTTNTEENAKDRRVKSIQVAGHILVTMLIVSAIAALVEVLRIRFAQDKDAKTCNVSSRKASTVDLTLKRRFIPRQPMTSQRSFEIQGMHRSTLRLLGARPPPLIRRSSFPTPQGTPTNSSLSGTPNTRRSRRQSAESDEEIVGLVNALPHRTRLIRRH